MFRQALIAATALAALSTTAARAELIQLQYRFDYDHTFEHLTATTTDLTGQSGTGTITFDTSNLLSATGDANSQTLVFGSTSTWSGGVFPAPPSTDTDKLTLTLFTAGGLAGTAAIQSDLAANWSVGSLDHARTQVLNSTGTFTAVNPAAPTSAELLSLLQSSVGKMGSGFGNHKASTVAEGTQSFTDLIGTLTVTQVTAVPEADSLALLLAGLGVAGIALRRRAA